MTEEELIAFRESMHVPSDTPAHLIPELVDIMNRIPQGWGKWISMDKGWYQLIANVNNRLRTIDPGYEVHQVKEKFGSLRYYFGVSPLPELECCTVFDEECPMPARRSWVTDDPRASEYAEAFRVWSTAHDVHWQTLEHIESYESQDSLRRVQGDKFHHMQDIVDMYESASMETCELCGEDGTLSVKGGWWKTTCAACGDPLGYVKFEEGAGG